MRFDPVKWKTIDELAASEGVAKETRKKWRVRGVPSAWRIKLVRLHPGLFSFEDFEEKGNAA